MGYDDLGAHAPEWRSFAFQKKAAGKFASRLMIGLPSERAKWRGNRLDEHLDWLRGDGGVGVAIWDAQLPNAAWRTNTVWRTLREIRGPR